MGRGQHEDGKQPFLPYTLLLCILLSIARVSAQDANICDTPITVDGVHYDLQPLAGQHSAKYAENTPPTQYENVITFDICKDLEKSSSVSDSDQCPTGTRACFTRINKKEGETDRVVEVIPVAQSSALEPKYLLINSPEALSIHLHNPSFSVEGKSIPQMLNLTLVCNKDSSDPSFVSHQNNIVSVEWNTPVGCKASETNEPDETGTPGSNGSNAGRGIGWFFILLLLCFFGYFAIGAYYNYNRFGASGWDLIPHRDFWREVPYLFRDFLGHFCATFRPGYQGSRRGYVAV